MVEDESFDFSSFIFRFELSSADLSTCIVAAICSEYCEANYEIAVCRPDDDAWVTFPKLGYYFDDVLFSNGVLCVLDRSAELEETYTLTLDDGEEQEVELMLKIIPKVIPLPDPDGVCEVDPMTDTFCVFKGRWFSCYLIQTNDGLLILERIKDEFESVFVGLEEEDFILNLEDNEEEDEFQGLMEEEDEEEDEFQSAIEDDDEEEDDLIPNINFDNENLNPNMVEDAFIPDFEEEDEDVDLHYFHYCRMSGFNVYKLDRAHGGELCATKLESLGDQMLFVADNGMLAKEIKGWRGNCIYFDKTIDGYMFEEFEPPVSRERGVFYLDDGMIKRPFPSISRHHLIQFCTTWFTPIPW